MSIILTNTKVASDMSELEIRARKGDIFAQDEIQKRCMNFSRVMMSDMKDGADMKDRKGQLK